MSRPVRIVLSGGLYHVTARGEWLEATYEDDADRVAFLELLGEVISAHNWLCHAYYLMANLYHLVIETQEGNLSKGMRQLNSVYA